MNARIRQPRPRAKANEGMPNTGFRLEPELLEKIDALAAAEHIARSAWVRRALWQAVEKAGIQSP